MDDQDVGLVQAIARGDHLAFKGLVERYHGRLFNFLYRYLRDRQAAEDVTQEVFLRIYQAAPRFKPQGKVRTWIFTIAHNLAMNDLKRRRRRGVLGLLLGEGRDSVAVQPQDPSERLELEETVTKALAVLPAKQRAALLLRVRDDLSYQEIGKILGISRAGVESLLFRARERLRRLLRNQEAS